MQIACFNANGIRARMPILQDWLAKEAPDILCLQETKVQDHDFPCAPFEEKGYHCAFKGQKSYNGVAVFSKAAPLNFSFGFQPGDDKDGPRMAVVRFKQLVVVNTYVPQGREPDSEYFRYKIDWFGRLRAYFNDNFDPSDAIIWTGDFNVAPTPLDVYDPQKLWGRVGYHPEEHAALANVMQWGFEDLYRRHNPDEKAFTFWDYRIANAAKRGIGWRLDHICATKALAAKSMACWIDIAPRLLPRPSDHTFIVAEFDGIHP